jgi:hypothetical protein
MLDSPRKNRKTRASKAETNFSSSPESQSMSSGDSSASEDETTNIAVPTTESDYQFLAPATAQRAALRKKRKQLNADKEDESDSRLNKKARFFRFLRDKIESKWLIRAPRVKAQLKTFNDEATVTIADIEKCIKDAAYCEKFNLTSFTTFIQKPFVNEAIKKLLADSSFYKPVLDDAEIRQFFDIESHLNVGIRKFLTLLEPAGIDPVPLCQNGLPLKTAFFLSQNLNDNERCAIMKISLRGLNAYIQSMFKVFSGGAYCENVIAELESLLPDHLQNIRKYKERVSYLLIYINCIF